MKYLRAFTVLSLCFIICASQLKAQNEPFKALQSHFERVITARFDNLFSRVQNVESGETGLHGRVFNPRDRSKPLLDSKSIPSAYRPETLSRHTLSMRPRQQKSVQASRRLVCRQGYRCVDNGQYRNGRDRVHPPRGLFPCLVPLVQPGFFTNGR